MADVLAVVSKAVFDKEARAHGLSLGAVWPTEAYASAGKGLAPLADGGRLFLVTVRPPDEALWLVAILDQPSFDGAAWNAVNETPIRDVSSLKKQIAFANGAGLPDKPGVLGMSLQTPRVLSEQTAALLADGKAPKSSRPNTKQKPATSANPVAKSKAKSAPAAVPSSSSTRAVQIDQEVVLARWHKTRSPRLADLLCCVPVDDGWPERLAAIARTRNGHGERTKANKSIKALPDDPRTTVFLIGMLAKANWPGSSAKFIWETVSAKLVELKDRRAIEPLRAMVATPPYFQGAGFTKWCVELIGTTADKLAKLPATPDDAATIKLADAQQATPPKLGWFATSSTAGADALLAKVWAAPEDLPLRSVIGDALQELGDPWGELIALQVAGAKPDSPAIKALLKKHGARFGGPLVHVGARENMTFEQGFLASVVIDRQMVGRRRWEDVVGAPHWATIRRVGFGPRGQTPRWFFKEWLAKSNLTSLREISILNVTLIRASATAPWKLEKAPQRIEWAVEDTVDALLQGMPAAELSRIPAPAATKFKRLLANALEAAS